MNGTSTHHIGAVAAYAASASSRAAGVHGVSASGSKKSASEGTDKHPPAGYVTISKNLLASLRPTKVFRPAQPAASSKHDATTEQVGSLKQTDQSKLPHITSMCFDDRGEHLVTAAENETFQVYDCRKGKSTRTLYSKKYGVHLARFTHTNSAIIHASTKEDDTIRQHSLEKNTYLQYHRGHKAKVTTLQMSPLDETFLSGAVDESVRLWDLRSSHTQGLMRVKGHPIVAYDSTGLVFALTISERALVLLYDVRSFHLTPFLSIALPERTVPTALAFSPSGTSGSDGSLLLVGTANDTLYILDTRAGVLRFRLLGHQGLQDAAGGLGATEAVQEAGISGQEFSWSADGAFIVAGEGHPFRAPVV
ncbi:WD40 repeat-like protein [Ceraceosorus guamensis]|uniref:WD40 repeat-like protein n=1 Tax=Ceraceosorus guamensis TaxID=1522189 RepID=A0A316W382_9BASI|nr:WD40 repeat-like protein [Ceraceosorus guamensis]PWN44250.1 WD40 repeat-like protein [Ceraceosorus guamensis]